MRTSTQELWSKVEDQKVSLPALYGSVDFSLKPERFVDDPEILRSMPAETAQLGAQLLADEDQVSRIRAYTMLGDVVADAYAALIPQYGFRKLIAMLTDACDRGVEAVEGAPPELVAFIRAMEQIPEWLDRRLIEEGARAYRNTQAHQSPFTIRGAFIATFLNKYSALPMALTGALSNETSARRVKETASFFTTTVLPNALDRHGAGFKAAAMVRLMHSMVRFNALRSGRWDWKVYGIPIPQVDQMPAGLIPVFLLSLAVLRQGRTTFTPAERARVELSRYRCYLLGLPEELLADTPQGIIKVMTLRQITLRSGWDDETCGALLRATMAASLVPDQRLRNRLRERFERSFSKVIFVRAFMGGDIARAERLGVSVTKQDRRRAAVVAGLVALRMAPFKVAERVPLVRDWADAALVKRLHRILSAYGHAEYTTDASTYRPTVKQAA